MIKVLAIPLGIEGKMQLLTTFYLSILSSVPKKIQSHGYGDQVRHKEPTMETSHMLMADPLIYDMFAL